MKPAHALIFAMPLFVLACQRQAQPPPTSSPGTPPTVRPTAAAPAPVKAPDALASRNTDADGVVADVMEFRRKGNTLTAVIRLRSQASTTSVITNDYDHVYVMDEAGAKKYVVLKDEKDGYIASWIRYAGLTPGGTLTYWVKFPAPPRELRSATLVGSSATPFEDLPIQDQ